MSKEKPESGISDVGEGFVEAAAEASPAAIDASLSSQDLAQRVEEAEKKALLYQADLENFRRRKNREAAEQVRYASLPLIEELLVVVDNLSRALESSRTDSTEPDSLHQGVEMVCEQLENILANHGCHRIAAIGEIFDPNLHEAVQMQPSDQPANTIVAELQTGYKLHDRVVRPAKVIISTGESSS